MHNYTDLTHRKEYFRISHSLPLPHPFRSWLSLPYAQIFLLWKICSLLKTGKFLQCYSTKQTEDITPASIIILFLQAQRLGYVSIFMGSLISKDLHVLQIGPNLFLTSTEKLKEEGTRFFCLIPHSTVPGRDPGPLPVLWRSGQVPLGTAYINENKPRVEVTQWGTELCSCPRAWGLTPGSYRVALWEAKLGLTPENWGEWVNEGAWLTNPQGLLIAPSKGSGLCPAVGERIFAH